MSRTPTPSSFVELVDQIRHELMTTKDLHLYSFMDATKQLTPKAIDRDELPLWAQQMMSLAPQASLTLNSSTPLSLRHFIMGIIPYAAQIVLRSDPELSAHLAAKGFKIANDESGHLVKFRPESPQSNPPPQGGLRSV